MIVYMYMYIYTYIHGIVYIDTLYIYMYTLIHYIIFILSRSRRRGVSSLRGLCAASRQRLFWHASVVYVVVFCLGSNLCSVCNYCVAILVTV